MSLKTAKHAYTGGEILDAIYEQHHAALGAELWAIIGCGSIGEGQAMRSAMGSAMKSASGDIDYLVVLETVDVRTCLIAAQVRAQLEAQYGIDMSNTVVAAADYELFLQRPQALDGKAAQAFIEVYGQPALLRANRSIVWRLPSDEAIVQFSITNFFMLKALLVKQLVRADQHISIHKLSKLALICLKMAAQAAHDPQLFTEGSLEAAHQAGKLLPWQADAYKELHAIKALWQTQSASAGKGSAEAVIMRHVQHMSETMQALQAVRPTV